MDPNKHMLKGKDQKNRNTTWWSDNIKPGKDLYFDLIKKYTPRKLIQILLIQLI